ncbi:MAG: prepilin-type N-terminal cleavage/methylation domain-containing protein [Desulfobacterales bacterium]|jgi:type IV pilus assembly protein PilW|nr:prepilin-type N-terminal cleavage/methylation domain-containing protein [Desulfobacterales bacterium]MDP6683697.1 prepilin-type N-terminal cleavage/methylation domain-containing protein [Desulfobacterales bacterium]MDP6807902.1 prepilin-type N-terminal cleavage/methylation domain-containing protein [Desulfobacterales bacterium]
MDAKTLKNGFTLVELLVAMAVTLIVVAALVSVFTVQNKYFTRQSEIVEIQEDVRSGLQMMISELTMAGYDPTKTSGAGMISADTNIIQFSQDLEGNGDILDPHEDIEYTYDAIDQQLTRNSQPLAENIQALAFKYYDENNVELTSGPPLIPADLANVRRIVVTLTAVSRDGDRIRTLSSGVRPRNLGLAGSGTGTTTTTSTTSTTSTSTSSTTTTIGEKGRPFKLLTLQTSPRSKKMSP